MIFFKEREHYPNKVINAGEVFQYVIRKISKNKIRIEGMLNSIWKPGPAVIELELLPIKSSGLNFRYTNTFNPNYSIPTVCPMGMLEEEFESYKGAYSRSKELEKRIQSFKDAPDYYLSSRSKWILFSFDYVLQTYYKEKVENININIGIQVFGTRMYIPAHLRIYCTMIGLWGLLSDDINTIPDICDLHIRDNSDIDLHVLKNYNVKLETLLSSGENLSFLRDSDVNLVLSNKEFIPRYSKLNEKHIFSNGYFEWI